MIIKFYWQKVENTYKSHLLKGIILTEAGKKLFLNLSVFAFISLTLPLFKKITSGESGCPSNGLP